MTMTKSSWRQDLTCSHIRAASWFESGQKYVLSVRNIGGTKVLVPGHQNSGAPTFFFGVFLMVFSHLCWQCSDKTRKCQEHKNTLRKKEKLIFLMPILEIKTKNLFSWKGHQSSGAWAPELWCPKILLVVLCTHIRWQSSSYFLVHINITKTTTTIQHL